MKKSITLVAGLLLFTLVATATDTEGPKFEAFLGYTTLRTDLQSNTPLLDQKFGSYFMNGGSGQFIYNFSPWFSGVVDLGAVNRGNVNVFNVDDRTAFFLAGPRVSYKRSSRWSPYFQVLFGAADRSLSKSLSVVTGSNTPELPVGPNTPVVTPHDPFFPGPGVEITANVSASQTAFSMTAGGGLDVKVSKRFAIRPFAIDYMLTSYPSLVTGTSTHQNGLRLSAGVLFRFGGEK